MREPAKRAKKPPPGVESRTVWTGKCEVCGERIEEGPYSGVLLRIGAKEVRFDSKCATLVSKALYPSTE